MIRNEFSVDTMQRALARQKYFCASCGEKIISLGKAASSYHKFGEIAQAHHMKHCQLGGSSDLSNCVILCYSCHYSVHNGGDYRNRARYLITVTSDYKYFTGKTGS
jgi:5-methylcytosine-specific restriction endonuclease McrA